MTQILAILLADVSGGDALMFAATALLIVAVPVALILGAVIIINSIWRRIRRQISARR
jgi:hypothetical protein